MLWLIFALALSEEPRSILQSLLPQPIRSPKTIRVVTLNCASSEEALMEVAIWQPDLVLSQESPGKESLVKLANRLFGPDGTCVYGPDACIVGKNLIEAGPSIRVSNHVIARWSRPGQPAITVVSLRMMPPVFRLDYWNPECWRDYARDRRERRQELKDIWQRTQNYAAGTPVILGGDCNTPPDPGTFASISGDLVDCFGRVGRGWPGTAHNTYAFARIDQIWVSHELKPTSSWTQKTVHSDHRMVVADIELRQ